MSERLTILYGQIVDTELLKASYGKEFNDLHMRYKSIIEVYIEKYGSDSINEYSDIIHLEFKNPENAIKFAVNTFRKFTQQPRIPFRAAICYKQSRSSNEKNDFEEKELAFKLSQICSEGAILVEEAIVNAFHDKNDYHFQPVGNKLFEGFDSTTGIYALAENGFYIPTQGELSIKTSNKNSIAVLPFHNTSSEKKLDYICDGIAEEVIDSLTKSKDLFVTARSSSFMFRNKEISLQDISRKLNVSFILDGSIHKRYDNYRISFQLVDCSTGYNVISDTLDATFNDLYGTEKEISTAINQYFNTDESPKEQPKEDFYLDPTAYSYYLQGKHLSTSWEQEHVNRAIDLFNKALEIVPNYALAYAGLSLTYIHMAINRFDDYLDSMSNAIMYADKSIAADNTIADGYIVKALSTFWMGNWYVPDFEKNITAALAISPCNAEIRMFNGMLFLIKGELKRSLSEMLLAKQLDPYSQAINVRLGLVQYLNREYEGAFNTFTYLLETHQNKTYNILRIAWCCIQLKQYHKALELLDKSDKGYEFYNMIYSTYLVIYKALKNESKFFEYKDLIEQLPKEDPVTQYNLAVLNKLIGKTEQSIRNLEKTFQNPLFLFTFTQYDEFWEEFHEHPLFKELIVSKYTGSGNQHIKIHSDTKEFLELKLSDFLYAEAQDNYTLIVYKLQKKKQEKILRATLATVEKQLNQEGIIRCHRSYIINSNSGYSYHKSDKKALLKHPLLEKPIPVSRAKEKEIKELLQTKK